jgi:hypothetical protein
MKKKSTVFDMYCAFEFPTTTQDTDALEMWMERWSWRKLAIDTFSQWGDCRIVWYAMFRSIELYEIAQLEKRD